MTPTTAYDVRADTGHIEAVQTAALTRPGLGLRPVPAPFGSSEWWSMLGTRDLPVLTVSGVIDEVCWAGHGDWPECKVRDIEGEVTTWTRPGDYTRYVEGRRIEIEYLLQWAKDDSSLVVSGLLSGCMVVVSIRVEDGDATPAALRRYPCIGQPVDHSDRPTGIPDLVGGTRQPPVSRNRSGLTPALVRHIFGWRGARKTCEMRSISPRRSSCGDSGWVRRCRGTSTIGRRYEGGTGAASSLSRLNPRVW